jgi:hypothetical protein
MASDMVALAPYVDAIRVGLERTLRRARIAAVTFATTMS